MADLNGFEICDEMDSEEVFLLLSDVYQNPKDGEKIGGRWTRGLIASELAVGMCLGLRNKAQFLKALIMYRDNPDSLEISMLGTAPEWHRKGLMSVLLEELKRKASAKSKAIWLEVHERNSSAVGFYRAHDFIQVGQRAKYYADGSAALLMGWSPKE